MASGIPSVASPVGVNAKIIEHGRNGFLASSDGEWLHAIWRLVQDEDLRRRIGTRARESAADFTFEKHAPTWVRLLKDIGARVGGPNRLVVAAGEKGESFIEKS